MDLKQLPFNIDILKVDKELVKTLRPVRSTDIMGSTGQRLGAADTGVSQQLNWQGENALVKIFNDDGLFSIPIFGRVGAKERDNRFSYVDVKIPVFHPVIYRTIVKLKGFYKDLIAGRAYAVWDEKEKDFIPSNEVEGKTGFHFFVSHWEKIDFTGSNSPTRKERIKLIEKFKDRAMTDKILIMPAGLRDIRIISDGRLDFDPINEFYRKLVALSNIINPGNYKDLSQLDNTRHVVQMTFNSIFEHIESMLKNKKGFIQGKVASRRVFNGTRNVISSMDTSKRYLGGDDSPKVTDTVVGLYQVIKGVLPLTINLMRNGYLGEVFNFGGESTVTYLVNPKTLKREAVELNSTTKDNWTTIDGIEKIISSYGDSTNRFKPVMVDGYYLALIYKGPDKTFRIFGDIDELPDHFNKADVYPLTLVELIYLSGYRRWNDVKIIVTRYPVTGIGSTYPSDVYVKTTIAGERRMELGHDWKPIGNDFVAKEFPTRNPEAFVDTQIVSSVRMAGLGAD